MIPNNAINPPMITSPRETQKVPYFPMMGMVMLATSEPSVGRPPVKPNQNQPAAVESRSAGVMVTIQTRKPKANSG